MILGGKSPRNNRRLVNKMGRWHSPAFSVVSMPQIGKQNFRNVFVSESHMNCGRLHSSIKGP